ncbi:MAG TPA: bifunctional 4-hydroxy-3-methylbut-2-enyl diphosphate reductase/30S ribosomal protein S1 [Clostridiales bacterium]|nr:bifunctional 4-hydroxy-3-methylbut-2-enyl diphosphate reductase/30S ribosomal protein S1 [Clostridiales bacterium]
MIRVSESAGFCPGVRRAAEATEALADREKEGVYTLGELIHNRVYTEGLSARGVGILTPEEVPALLRARGENPTTVIIRTHGIPKEEEATLRRLEKEFPAFRLVDMTCPYVKRLQKIAEENTGEDTFFLLYADPNHPEAKGVISYAKGEKAMFSSPEELKALDFKGKIPILCSQTTQNLGEFKKIKKILKNLYTNAIFFDTICSVTEKRQEEAVRIAAVSDAMIVIGGHNSSNTQKLYDLCRAVGPDTVRIETAGDVFPDFGKVHQNIGITAGASTPRAIITEVFNAMTAQENNFATMLEESLTTLHTGDIVKGTVYAVNDAEIYLDLGAKFTGIISKDQITDDASAKLSDMFKVGDEVEAFVIRVEDGKGVATLSKKRVDRDKNWVVLKEAFENGEAVEGVVNAVVKGGVTMDIAGNRVFVPASQTGIPKDGDMTVLVGTKQKVKIIEFDETKKKAIASIKVILNEEKKEREAAIWASLEVGQHFMGTVKNLVPYGAFVDIGGIDGMVHNSELSWKRIKHPSQVVSVGQQIDVFIKELDPEKKRISLGYKTQENDMWFQFTQKYHVGDVVPAKIVSLMPFGAFAEVYPDVDGLIHISRISINRVNSPADVLSVGQVVNVKITEIDDENRRLALSIRALEEEARREEEAKARAEEKAARLAEEEEERKKEEEERADMAPYIVGSI